MALKAEKQEHAVVCTHRNRRVCRAEVDPLGTPYHYRWAWHVWDTDLNDYATGTGPAQFTHRRDAVAFITTRQETQP